MHADNFDANAESTLAASTAMPNTPHSEPKTFTSASKLPPPKSKYRIPPLPSPFPQSNTPHQSAIPPLPPLPGRMRGDESNDEEEME